jgi:hypothetical protein
VRAQPAHNTAHNATQLTLAHLRKHFDQTRSCNRSDDNRGGDWRTAGTDNQSRAQHWHITLSHLRKPRQARATGLVLTTGWVGTAQHNRAEQHNTPLQHTAPGNTAPATATLRTCANTSSRRALVQPVSYASGSTSYGGQVRSMHCLLLAELHPRLKRGDWGGGGGGVRVRDACVCVCAL